MALGNVRTIWQLKYRLLGSNEIGPQNPTVFLFFFSLWAPIKTEPNPKLVAALVNPVLTRFLQRGSLFFFIFLLIGEGA